MAGMTTKRRTQAAVAAMIEPWERLDDETEDAWLWFTRFRATPTPRSIADLIRAWPNPNGNLRDRSLIYGWAQRHRWRERVLAFDRHADQATVAGLMDERRVLGRRLAQVGDAGVAILSLNLAKILRTSQLADAPALAIVDLERLARLSVPLALRGRTLPGEELAAGIAMATSWATTTPTPDDGDEGQPAIPRGMTVAATPALADLMADPEVQAAALGALARRVAGRVPTGAPSPVALVAAPTGPLEDEDDPDGWADGDIVDAEIVE